MTELWIWGFVASLILLAISTSLKSAHDAFLLKQSDKEIARLSTEILSLKESHDKTVAAIIQSNVAEIEKLSKCIPQTTNISHDQRLEEIREKILVVVAKNERLHDAQIAELTGVAKPLATLHLHELREVKFVRSKFGLDKNSYQVDTWFVEQPGRKYLSNHGLL